jgi:hypothetical protein
VVSVDEISNNETSSYLLLAVSKDANPAMWYVRSTSTNYTIGGQPTWADQPRLTVDGSFIYVTSNQFSARTGDRALEHV